MVSKKSSLAFLAGIAAGAAIAILYTPQSGRSTRRTIKRKAQRAGDSLSDAGEYLRKQADRLNHDALSAIDRTRSQVQSVLEEASSAVTATLHEASKAFSANVDNAASAISAAVGSVTGRFTDSSS